MYPNNPRERNPNNFMLYLDADQEVKAAEDCKVVSVASAYNTFIVLARGRFEIMYLNLSRVNIKQGDSLAKGQKMGELLVVKDSPDAEILYLSVRKKGQKGGPVYDSGIVSRNNLDWMSGRVEPDKDRVVPKSYRNFRFRIENQWLGNMVSPV